MNKDKKIARDYWERASRNSARQIEMSPAREVEWKAIRQVFNVNPQREKKIVDFCCGTGYHAIRFLLEGFTVTGIDVSPGSLEVLKQRAKAVNKERNLKVVKSDLLKPIFDEDFDAGYIISSYHCLSFNRKERLSILKNFVKSIKVGGRFFMMEPNPLNPLFLFFYPFVYKENWREGLNLINSRLEIIKKDLQQAGIGEVISYRYGFLPAFLIDKCRLVENFNRFCCQIPVLKNFSSFNLVYGKRLK